MVGGLFKNAILAQLDEPCLERLHLAVVSSAKERRSLYEAGQTMDHVFFLESGFVSIAAPLPDGTLVSAGILGNRAVIGVEALLGNGSRDGWHEASTQWAGKIYSSPIERARREFYQNELFHHLVMEDLRIQFLRAVQLSACNTRHDVEQRLCRWLLLSHDEMEADDILATHEALADAMGICRSTATVAIDVLRRDGVIRANRAHISIVDRPALEARACGCYAIMHAIEGRRQSRLRDGRPPSIEHLPVATAKSTIQSGVRLAGGHEPDYLLQQ